MPISLPSTETAPARLLALKGNCGPLAAWCALRAYGRRVAADQIIEACSHTQEHGVFTIALATALHSHGLHVTFHSEADPAPHAIERQHYQRAELNGILVQPPLSVDDLLARLDRGHLPIVFYDTPSGEGHFSPLLGESKGQLLLPHSEGEVMTRPVFERAWSAPDILRQSVVVNGRRADAV
jgi:hypothetical protein